MADSESELTASVRAGELERVRALLDGGADCERRDEDGWTALCWAAASGHVPIVRLLIERGADVFATTGDGRTPYLIAIAASRVDAARLLGVAEAARDASKAARSSGQAATRPYCRGYRLGELRRCPGWQERSNQDTRSTVSDDDIVFVHRDFSVTHSIWPNEAVIFDGDSAEWRRACAEQLGFRPPVDFDWLPAPVAGDPAFRSERTSGC
jgi:hypothetical protein